MEGDSQHSEPCDRKSDEAASTERSFLLERDRYVPVALLRAEEPGGAEEHGGADLCVVGAE